MKRLGIALLVLLFSVIGCKSSTPPAADADRPVMLTVGHVGHDHQLALYMAAMAGENLAGASAPHLRLVKERQIYDLVDDGAVVARLKLIKVGGGSNMPAAMERGEIQIGLGGVPAVVKFADKGRPFRIICPLQADGDMLVMRTGSPVTDWASFVAACRADGPPLRIGYKAPVAVAKLVFIGALTAEGIAHTSKAASADDRVILVNMGGGKKAIPLLESGEIDGFVMNQPIVALAVHKGLGTVVAELRDLPPVGKWVNHPCCCVAASDETLAAHPEIVKSFLKVILLATERIKTDPDYAVEVASGWIKTPRAVEAASIPTVAYIGEPTGSWVSGMVTWLGLMQQAGGFNGRFAELSSAEFIAEACNLDFCRQAGEELREAGLLEKRQP